MTFTSMVFIGGAMSGAATIVLLASLRSVKTPSEKVDTILLLSRKLAYAKNRLALVANRNSIKEARKIANSALDKLKDGDLS